MVWDTIWRVVAVRPNGRVSQLSRHTGRRTRGATLALAAMLLGASYWQLTGAAPIPQPARIPRVGFLAPGASDSSIDIGAFRDGLRELGYAEGKDVVIEYRSAMGELPRLPALAAELVALPVDVMVATSSPAIGAAQRATNTIPIVMGVSADPVRQGFIASLSRPGGNITGLTTLLPELSGKRLEVLLEAVPTITRVGVLWNPANPAKVIEWQETQAAAEVLGVALVSLETKNAEETQQAIESAKEHGVEGLLILADNSVLPNPGWLAEMVAQSQLPAVYQRREFVDAGGLLAYGPSFGAMFGRSATFVDKIMKGASPSTLPVEQPTRFELVINLRAAQGLGLALPAALLLDATDTVR